MFIIVEKSGISERTLKSAKSLLGVRSVKRGGVWYWVLPIEGKFTYADNGANIDREPICADAVFVDEATVCENANGGDETNRASKGANAASEFLPPCLHS